MSNQGTSPADARAEADTLAVLAEVAAKRQRQRTAHGYTLSHDDREQAGTLAAGALTYGLAALYALRFGRAQWNVMPRSDKLWAWPWAEFDFRGGPTRALLLKAISLLVAEVERADRAASRDAGTTGARQRLPAGQ